MKHIHLWAVPALALMLSACGGSKKAAGSSDRQYRQWQEQQQQSEAQGGGLGVKKAKSEAQLYAEDPARTTLRDWAQANGFEDDDLESIAALDARAKLSESIAVLVSRAMKNYADRYGKQSLGAEGVQQRKTRDSKIESAAQSVAKELLVGSRIVVSDRFVQKNGTETAYVCVEISPEVVAANIRKNAEIQQAINENEQLKIDFQSKKFDEEMAGAFDELKAAKQNE